MTSSPRLSGKTAFVTAADQGIGRASAIAIARAGAQVIAIDVNADLLADPSSTCPLRCPRSSPHQPICLWRIQSRGHRPNEICGQNFVTQGIRCNAICPGTVESPSWHDRVIALGEQLGSYDTALDQFVSRQPMGCVASVGEIANLIVYLASNESAFTTGQAHIIDGGWAG